MVQTNIGAVPIVSADLQITSCSAPVESGTPPVKTGVPPVYISCTPMNCCCFRMISVCFQKQSEGLHYRYSSINIQSKPAAYFPAPALYLFTYYQKRSIVDLGTRHEEQKILPAQTPPGSAQAA